MSEDNKNELVDNFYTKQYKKYYDRHKAKGWKSVTIFGPPELCSAVKEFVKKYKRDNGLYTTNIK